MHLYFDGIVEKPKLSDFQVCSRYKEDVVSL